MVQYETEMPQAQYDAELWLIRHLLKLLPDKVVGGINTLSRQAAREIFSFGADERRECFDLGTKEQRIQAISNCNRLTVDGLAGNDTNNMFDSVKSILRILQAEG